MKDLQIKFCLAVTKGDSVNASTLASKIDVLETDPIGVSPALFCLWAINQPTQKMIIQMLAKISASKEEFDLDNNNNPSEIPNIIRELVFPKVDNKLIAFLKEMAPKIGLVEVMEEDSPQFHYLTLAQSALSTIIQNECFDKKYVELAEKMYSSLNRKMSIQTACTSRLANVRFGLSSLSLTSIAEEVEYETPTKAYLPSIAPVTSSKSHSTSKMEKELDDIDNRPRWK
ncbi:MAG: hypothetical protein HYX61_10705 [Gammaproteobacteria bacterium]|jgi:hypothetical protein|nr:hypothetical protein [Gammaproteobacteria bacterium]